MKTIFYSVMVLFFLTTCQSVNKANQSSEINYDDQLIEDSIRINNLVQLIVNEERLNGKIENIEHGQMVSQLFELITDTNQTTDLNKKVELLVLMSYFQDHYFDAYGSVASVGYNNVNLETKNLHYILKPFDFLPDSLTINKPDSIFINRLNRPNQMLYKAIDSIQKMTNTNVILNYTKVLRRYINEENFYSAYKSHLGSICRGQL